MANWGSKIENENFSEFTLNMNYETDWNRYLTKLSKALAIQIEKPLESETLAIAYPPPMSKITPHDIFDSYCFQFRIDLEGPFDKSHWKIPEYPAGKINKLIAINVAVTPSVMYSGLGKIEAQPGMKPCWGSLNLWLGQIQWFCIFGIFRSYFLLSISHSPCPLGERYHTVDMRIEVSESCPGSRKIHNKILNIKEQATKISSWFTFRSFFDELSKVVYTKCSISWVQIHFMVSRFKEH